MNIKYALLFLSFLVSSKAFSQNYLNAISESVCTIEFYDSSKLPNVEKKIATGTFFLVNIGSGGQSLLIVTNRHAIPKFGVAKQIFIKTRIMSDKDSLLRFGKGIPFDIYDKNYKLSKDVQFARDGADVAVINFSTGANLYSIGGSTLNVEFLATNDTLKKYQIGIGHDIFFLGYPNFYYDKRNNSPILRSGVIATDPLDDFYFNDDVIVQNFNLNNEVLSDKLQGFLIDASVFGGSSGSLVINKTSVVPTAIGGKRIPTIPYPYVLGIVTYSYFNFEGTGRLGLGGVISSRIIKQTIEDYISRLSAESR